ncbi:helix-turn-helix transcriptional regulator [Bacillus sp. ISL-55]|uniref:helix-turn-helix domain-containing protein n=1 Tax=Bacillus sp. ISL-55 TaxID=2819134 RepID=UPI001BE8EF60|nr:helix-turn-helix transcriptional regulator [Bacillus sp. ISL-55]MBT2693157.1 helix-turn-helix domain-containing protein [Bacillus sp. ISL-55]
MKFGEYLKTKREEKNLSMNKLGELSGVSAMYISHLESGKREKPSPDIIERLAKGLDEQYEKLMVAAGYIDAFDYQMIKNEQYEQEEKELSLDEQKQGSFYLDFLLDSNHPIFFQDRLLTREEKAKIKGLIEVFIRD